MNIRDLINKLEAQAKIHGEDLVVNQYDIETSSSFPVKELIVNTKDRILRLFHHSPDEWDNAYFSGQPMV